MIENRLKVMIFIQWYTPGYKAGGPTRAIQNFADLFNADFEIYIVTGDRDLGDTYAYGDIKLNQWIVSGKVSIIYLSNVHQVKKKYMQLLEAIAPDAIYLNSLYSYRFSILPLLAARSITFAGKIVIAPRGMLKASAIEFKKIKKRFFIFFTRQFQLFKNVFFQATDTQEISDIQNNLKINSAHISLVIDPPHKVSKVFPISKVPGFLKIAMIGRVHPIKGLDYLLNVLRNIKSEVSLHVIGLIEDKKYFNECEKLILTLPHNIKVEVKGNLPYLETLDILMQNHFMVLPTKGENYSHSVFEAFSAGRPVIISNQTPWRELQEKQIGWDIPLSEPHRFREVIEMAADMDQQLYDQYSMSARSFSDTFIKESKLKEKYLDLFKG